MPPDSSGPPKLDGYLIISRVGAGGYGSVFKARDLNTNQIVALKEVKIFNEIHGLPVSFYNERNALQTFKHPNIVRLLDIKSDVDYRVFLILEYVEFDLHVLCRNGLTLPHFLNYCRQIFSAVNEIHSCNYVHCDLKPANVLVTRDNLIKLADFGLTRKINGKPMSPKVVTPSYRAPELLLRVSYFDQAVDIWSLGCMLYEMITGIHLFMPSFVSDVDQLISIFKVIGSPDNQSPLYHMPNSSILDEIPYYPPQLESILNLTIPDNFKFMIPILISILKLDTKERVTIQDLMSNPFFVNEVEISSLDLPDTHALDFAALQKPKAKRVKKVNLPIKIPQLPILVF